MLILATSVEWWICNFYASLQSKVEVFKEIVTKRYINVKFILSFCLSLCILAGVGYSDLITDDDFLALHRAGTYGTGSGLGGLDLVFLAGATIPNSTFDDGYVISGNPAVVDAFYITSIADIRNFYELQFSDGIGGSTITEMMIMMDLNESVAGDVNFDLLDVIINSSDVYDDARDTADTADISSATQFLTTVATGGTTIANYATDTSFTTSKATVENGSGWADYGVSTGINPFDVAYADTDRITFHIQFSSVTNGSEEIFLSGEYSTEDVIAVELPEPATMLLLGLGGLFLRKRKA